MNQKDDNAWDLELELPHTSSRDLRGKQSVRATFKLSSKAIEALTIVSVHLGIKQKSLFDHLVEDADALDTVARNIQPEQFQKLQRIQKTFVLSRRTLASLEQVSDDLDAPRDALVEYSIQRLLPIIAREKRKHRQRKQLLAGMEKLMADTRRLMREADDAIGDDDPVFERLRAGFEALQAARDDIAAFVRKGSLIEDF